MRICRAYHWHVLFGMIPGQEKKEKEKEKQRYRWHVLFGMIPG
jgi:hypothetical protein